LGKEFPLPPQLQGTAHDPDQERIATERAALCILCQGADGQPVWEEALQLLNAYRFRDLTLQVVFDTLRRIPNGRPEAIRQQLQRRLAVAGFPDLDVKDFFQPHGLTYEQAVALLRSLAESPHDTPS